MRNIKAKVRKEQFLIDSQNAFEMGKKLAFICERSKSEWFYDFPLGKTEGYVRILFDNCLF